MNFTYDALNRQVWRSVTDQPDTFSVWDGWDLIEEYQAANNGAATAAYLYGATGLIADSHVENSEFNYYYQDADGSTSHLADTTGHLLEWYRYDLDGTPFFYDASDSQLSATNNVVRHLFTGQQWYQDLGLYDLRNRFYSPISAASSSLTRSVSGATKPICIATAGIIQLLDGIPTDCRVQRTPRDGEWSPKSVYRVDAPFQDIP